MHIDILTVVCLLLYISLPCIFTNVYRILIVILIIVYTTYTNNQYDTVQYMYIIIVPTSFNNYKIC